MDILFGQSYYLRFDHKLYESMQPYHHSDRVRGESDARARLQRGIVRRDASRQRTRMGAALDQHNPRYAVLFEDNFNYLSKMCLLRMREAAFTMSRMAVERGYNADHLRGDATDHAALYLQNGASYIIRARR